MEIFAAYGSLAVTLGLVVTRPQVRGGLRIGPAPAAAAGVLIMLAARVVSWGDVAGAAVLLVKPLAGIVALMVMAAAAERVGVVERLAAGVFFRARGGARSLFAGVFALSFVTAAMLNNDSAVLLLTPAIVGLVRRRYPERPDLVAPFAFAVFMAAGVAPLVLSNPMNMIVASYAGIDFNAYARAMVPIAIAGSLVALGVLLVVFRRALGEAPAPSSRATPHTTNVFRLRPAQRRVLAVVGCVLAACPVVAYVGGPVGAVAVLGAVVATFIAARDTGAHPLRVVRDGIAWDVLAFLGLVNLLGAGLKNVGFVASLASVYAHGGVAGVGAVSALGSAVLNNHPMAILNMLALESIPTAASRDVLAALVGGDLGPRLLPMGSLAGLLWLDLLRRHRVEISIGRFFLVGAAVTIPTLAVSLLLLA